MDRLKEFETHIQALLLVAKRAAYGPDKEAAAAEGMMRAWVKWKDQPADWKPDKPEAWLAVAVYHAVRDASESLAGCKVVNLSDVDPDGLIDVAAPEDESDSFWDMLELIPLEHHEWAHDVADGVNAKVRRKRHGSDDYRGGPSRRIRKLRCVLRDYAPAGG